MRSLVTPIEGPARRAGGATHGEFELFVPGRLCLFGEHSDWAGGYRRTNLEVGVGRAIITGTTQGLYARIRKHPSDLVLTSTLSDGTRCGPMAFPMELNALYDAAQAGGFFSYAAGVAYQLMTHYRVRGLEIDNFQTDLPVKKGLSSSAAVSVLVARAFNRAYDLKMTVRGEMEYAYLGEVTTPSRCGRLDQGCAFGDRPVLMTFDGDALGVQEIRVGGEIFLVVVDLCAGKNTKTILADLNRAYPTPRTDIESNVHTFLGDISSKLVEQACRAIEAGDASELGRLMVEAQREFDRLVAPACPSELSAPVLHRLLTLPSIQPLIYGGKGVGSQGDGTAQLVARSATDQDKVVDILREELGMPALKMKLGAVRTVRKALITAAGFGGDMFPASKAIQKELFPVVDAKGRCKPAILTVVEEAIESGIDEVGVVVHERDKPFFENLFHESLPIENHNRLSRENKEYCAQLLELGGRVTLLCQGVQEGFGHAVYSAREWVGNEPFLLLLGDHIYASEGEVRCARQLLDVYERTGSCVVGLKTTPLEEVHHFGCVAGDWIEDRSLLDINEFVEKPDQDYARKRLIVDGCGEDRFLSIFGMYVLTPRVFAYLGDAIENNVRQRGEFQLTPCLESLREDDRFLGYVVRGFRFDIGNPGDYRRSLIDFALA